MADDNLPNQPQDITGRDDFIINSALAHALIAMHISENTDKFGATSDMADIRALLEARVPNRVIRAGLMLGAWTTVVGTPGPQELDHAIDLFEAMASGRGGVK